MTSRPAPWSYKCVAKLRRSMWGPTFLKPTLSPIPRRIIRTEVFERGRSVAGQIRFTPSTRLSNCCFATSRGIAKTLAFLTAFSKASVIDFPRCDPISVSHRQPPFRSGSVFSKDKTTLTVPDVCPQSLYCAFRQKHDARLPKFSRNAGSSGSEVNVVHSKV